MLALAFNLDALWSLVGKFHPLVVHFPIALLMVAGLLELVEWRRGRGPSRESLILVRIGALAAVVSAVSGWSFAETHSDSQTLFLHRWGGIGLAVLASLAALASRGNYPARAYRPIAILCLPIVGAVGHFGGELSWGEGYIQKAIVAVFEEREEVEAIPTVAKEDRTPEEEHFVASVWPILRDRCIECHGPTKQKGDLRLDNRADTLAAEAIVIPGDPESSDLIFLVETEFEEERMPPTDKGPALTAEEIAALRKWITDGVAWPAGELPDAPETGFLDGLFDDWFPTAHAEEPESEAGDPRTPEQLFEEVVWPTFEKNCIRCHGEEKQKGKLRLDRPDDLFDESRPETIVVREIPDDSALYDRVSLPADDFDVMPPDGKTLSEAEITAIHDWIEGGAPWVTIEKAPPTPPTPPVAEKKPVATDTAAIASILYRATIEPLLIERCGGCHGSNQQRGGLRVDEERSLGRVITAGDPSASELFVRVTHPAGHEKHMPKQGRPLTPLELEALEVWIAAGAPTARPAPNAAAPTDPTTNAPETSARPGVTLPPRSAPGAITQEPIELDEASAARVGEVLEILKKAGAQASLRSLADDAVEVSTSLLGDRAGDEIIALLTGLEPALVRLDLRGAKVTDEGIARLAEFTQLRTINLAKTPVTDTALETLAKLPHLEVINVFGTAVSDRGIDRLHETPALRRIYLWQTKVTDAGADALQAAKPELRIIRGN